LKFEKSYIENFSKNYRKIKGFVTLPEGPSVKRREPKGHQGPKEQSPHS
jgi:hypothetical protein